MYATATEEQAVDTKLTTATQRGKKYPLHKIWFSLLCYSSLIKGVIDIWVICPRNELQ